jgi:hypothetical protein
VEQSKVQVLSISPISKISYESIPEIPEIPEISESSESSEVPKKLEGQNNTNYRRKYDYTRDSAYVSVQLNGRLGNQLFQVAAAYAYAKKHKKLLITDHTMQKVEGGSASYFDSVLKWTTHSTELRQLNWYNLSEKYFHYNELPECFGNVRLKGYFQSLKYFTNECHELIDLFKANTPPIPTNNVTLRAITQSTLPTVSVHIRRGDYVGHSMHPVQPMSYYTESCRLLRTQLNSDITLVVFSDDMNWCKSNMTSLLSEHTVFVESKGLTDTQELVIMSECAHHIIANSSFSWWGATYNTKPNKIVVAPKLWFNDKSYNWNDIYSPGWITI